MVIPEERGGLHWCFPQLETHHQGDRQDSLTFWKVDIPYLHQAVENWIDLKKLTRLGRTLQRPQAFSAWMTKWMTHAKWVINAFVSIWITVTIDKTALLLQEDLYYPHPLVQDILWASLHKGAKYALLLGERSKFRGLQVASSRKSMIIYGLLQMA
ncbi:hypothetical protein FNV43_RR19089 [Rhamnella rubrinervis]|uniref:Uncharacterized protein n=1 Tax=Rhamnella rubrinervis TaxID=2594499 RepID=A0A8K0GWX3_9ROSA|nr:hypothetical protein FNV43_RR19089 [Rhamnella rubrinervis]